MTTESASPNHHSASVPFGRTPLLNPRAGAGRQPAMWCAAVVLGGFGWLLTSAVPAGAAVSQLWGKDGEAWSPASRLPDFSYAGYRRGEEPYRIPAAHISVTDFGAKGDGRTNDTAAFQKAIAAGAGKVILIPAGRYVLDGILHIRGSNLVLRGAGPGKSVLLFSRSLETIEPHPVKNDGGTPTSNWSWSGGLIMIGDAVQRNAGIQGPSARVISPASRGSNRLITEKQTFRPGDEVVLALHDTTAKTLLRYLYHDQTGDMSQLSDWRCRQVFRIRSVRGGELTLDRGLRFDVRAEWNPVLEPFQPLVTDVGVEGISFEFPSTPYAGHFKEKGWNPLAIRGSAAHCWIKDILVHNGDNGPFVERAAFCTLENIRITADAARGGKSGVTGHHGITLEGDDILCRNFVIETRFIHDLTVQSALGCVFASGRALDLSMDHHRWAPYENLYSDIDAGEGRRLFQSSGGGGRGLHTAAGATFWNIRARKPSAWPAKFGPDQINIIGLPMSAPQTLDRTGRWIENFPPGELRPAELQSAMRAKRLGH